MDKQYDELPKKVQSEITREMWDGLIKLKGRLKKNGYTKLRCNHELTTTETVVIEAISPPPSNHKHWFQVARNGDLTGYPTCMRYKGGGEL